LGFDRLAEAIAAMAEVVEDGGIFGLKLEGEGEALAGALVIALLGEVDAVLVVVADALLGGGFAAREDDHGQEQPQAYLRNDSKRVGWLHNGLGVKGRSGQPQAEARGRDDG